MNKDGNLLKIERAQNGWMPQRCVTLTFSWAEISSEISSPEETLNLWPHFLMQLQTDRILTYFAQTHFSRQHCCLSIQLVMRRAGSFTFYKLILLYNKLFCGTKSKSKYLKLKGKWTRSTEAIMCQGHHVGDCSHWKIHCCLQIRTEHCSSHTTADICDNRLTIFHTQHKRMSFKSVC